MPFPKKGDIVYVARQNYCGEVVKIQNHNDKTVSLDIRVNEMRKGYHSLFGVCRALCLRAREIRILNTPQKVFADMLLRERRSDTYVGKKLIKEISGMLLD